jgi:hypothetical protein
MLVSKCDLKIDWATHAAAKYACENWHYSGCLPGAKKQASVGVWENNKFIGAVIFSPGATASLGSPYGLNQIQCTELVRVALTSHITEVSKIISISLRFIKKHSPGIRLIVSFADPYQEHHGGIYQAGNWIYTGKSASTKVFLHEGKIIHPRTLGASDFKKGKKKQPPIGAQKILLPGKHRYLMPLDNEMRKRILPLSKPYPKRAGSDTTDTAGHQPAKGGSIPTPALHSQAA